MAVLLAARVPPGYNQIVPATSTTLRVKVLFFGRLKDIVGSAEDSLEFSEPSIIEAVFASYCARHRDLKAFRSSLVASRNQEVVPWNTPLQSGDEIAFLPPVSGG